MHANIKRKEHSLRKQKTHFLKNLLLRFPCLSLNYFFCFWYVLFFLFQKHDVVYIMLFYYVVPSKTSSHEYILWNAFWQPCCWGRQHWCLMERIENTFHSNTCSTTLHPFILYSNVFTPKHLRSQIRLHTQHYRMYVVSTFHPLTATVCMYCWWASEHIGIQ